MNLTVLVVDDDHMIRRGTMRVLKGLGWRVLEASDPIEASELVEQADVILTDWDMPYGGGSRVLDEALIPVVVYSGNERLAGHVERLVLKPGEAAVLDRALRDALAQTIEDAKLDAEEAEEAGDLEDRLNAQLRLADLGVTDGED